MRTLFEFQLTPLLIITKLLFNVYSKFYIQCFLPQLSSVVTVVIFSLQLNKRFVLRKCGKIVSPLYLFSISLKFLKVRIHHNFFVCISIISIENYYISCNSIKQVSPGKPGSAPHFYCTKPGYLIILYAFDANSQNK